MYRGDISAKEKVLLYPPAHQEDDKSSWVISMCLCSFLKPKMGPLAPATPITGSQYTWSKSLFDHYPQLLLDLLQFHMSLHYFCFRISTSSAFATLQSVKLGVSGLKLKRLFQKLMYLAVRACTQKMARMIKIGGFRALDHVIAQIFFRPIWTLQVTGCEPSDFYSSCWIKINRNPSSDLGNASPIQANCAFIPIN